MTFSDFNTLNKHEFIEKFYSYAKKINVPEKYYPTFDNPRSDDVPNIEFCKEGYYYVINDRGIENRRFTALTDELLYWIFKNSIFYYLLNEIKEKDSINILYSQQINLLHNIDPDFAVQAEKDIRYLNKDFRKID